MAISDFRAYVKAINDKRNGDTERTHYPAMQNYLEAALPGYTVVCEAERVESNAPDFLIKSASGRRVGYIEMKPVGANLDDSSYEEQFDRYKDLGNVIFSNYLEFRWFRDDEQHGPPVNAAYLDGDRVRMNAQEAERLETVLDSFVSQGGVVVGTAAELAKRLADLAAWLRVSISGAMKQDEKDKEASALWGLHEAFKEILLPDLDAEEFADMYAQTIAYGLFAARVNVGAAGDFTREHAAYDLPKTNPFLRKLFGDIAGPDLDDRLVWIVDDIVSLLRDADMANVMEDFAAGGREEDPVVHFYEDFLSEYDPKERKVRGVYYTPEPVVSYIVRSVDHLLKEKFDKPDGLADPSVYILDPAVGTGTFLYFVIQHIHDTLREKGQLGGWNDYVKNNLLPRIFGFEIMMAPYTICHMKLGMLLQELGYDFETDDRLGVYLTNTLEQAAKKSDQLFGRYISEEANAAADIKRDKPIMVVLGNPPYSVSSQNKGEWIEGLMDDYKEAVRDEKNIQPLSDDYIKFLRFAHWRIDQTGEGIVGMITNNSFYSGLIHRGMRESLMESFSDIWLLDLHGSSVIREKTPAGGKDENVFDIRQGVAISTLANIGDNDHTEVKQHDAWGLREQKYNLLSSTSLEDIPWQTTSPCPPNHWFTGPQSDHEDGYHEAWSISEVFVESSSGVKTHRDHFVIDFDDTALQDRIADFRDSEASNQQLYERYNLRDNRDWKLPEARKALQQDSHWKSAFRTILYRPFDFRAIFYHDDLIDLARQTLTRDMLPNNCALLVGRAGHVVDTSVWGLLFASGVVSDTNCFYRGGATTFPLYTYPVQNGVSQMEFRDTREPNLSQEFTNEFSEKLGLEFVEDGQGDLEATFGPEAILFT